MRVPEFEEEDAEFEHRLPWVVAGYRTDSGLALEFGFDERDIFVSLSRWFMVFGVAIGNEENG